jgi:hypothetical protein
MDPGTGYLAARSFLWRYSRFSMGSWAAGGREWCRWRVALPKPTPGTFIQKGIVILARTRYEVHTCLACRTGA